MLTKFVRIFGGDPNKRAIEKYLDTVDQINDLESKYEALSDEALRAKTDEFRSLLAEQLDGVTDTQERKNRERQVLDQFLPEAYAAVREASKRTNGQRHFDVQLIGGIALHQGKIAEMRTGEGKTLVATLPLYLNALTGRGVHLVTVNDYLARRDARWMGPIYNALGLSVGVLQMAARTENGKKAFLVDLERSSPHEDQHQLRIVPRREAYAADIIYGTNSEFGFDYLRDNMTMSLDDRVQRGHYFAIVDEVDNVLIDEARTPLIISGPAEEETEWYVRMAQVARQLRPEDYEINERDRTVTLSEIGEAHVEELLGIPLRDPDRPEDVTPEQARLIGHLEQALRAQFLFRRNKDYLVQAGKVIIIDEFTGRLMPGRRWSDGLHQAVEAKEGARVQAENVTYATITIQNYFRMYEKLSGMTGTAVTEAEEFDKIYKLEVLAIPTNLEYQAFGNNSALVELEDRDGAGYKYSYYARRDDQGKRKVYWKRKDYPDVIYRTEEAKFRSITQEILHYHTKGSPLLVGTTSVELSERLSGRLKAELLHRLAQVLLLRSIWMEKNNRLEDGRVIQELEFLYAPLEQLQIPDLRKMARDLGISFSPEEPSNLSKLLAIMKLTEDDQERLVTSLQAGIPHQVLNARKHTEESQIIAGAGAFGAVTIATNMAGRGVDIKLGGELAEEVIAAVNRVLRKAGYDDPFNMTQEERHQAILALKPVDYGIYEAEVNYFLKYLEDMRRVKSLGGLHIIGSERHEARRIDNQLRGRSARQGDPGSSRFYLSMEDELMRRFGGEQVNSLMQRLKVDDAMPIEVGLVSRLVEQSQTRVEGANFDIRKHLLEYDDVLNSQRAKIYAQRDLIFTKEDLSEDVTEMLRTEVLRRVPDALGDEEGPWKLLAWLDQVQPPLQFGEAIFTSYSLRLLLEYINNQLSDISHQVSGKKGQELSEERRDQGLATRDQPSGIQPISVHQLRSVLLEIASESLKAEEYHLLRAVNLLVEQTQDRLESQLREHLETVDTFFEGINLNGGAQEEEGGNSSRSPRELVDELTSLIHIPIRLSPEAQRKLIEDPDQAREEVRSQTAATLNAQAVTRLFGAIARRLEDPLDVNPAQLSNADWQALSGMVIDAVQNALIRRRERLLGNHDENNGQIVKDLENSLERLSGPLTSDRLTGLLLMMPQGTRTTFDKKTHRRMWQRTTRLTYIYYAAQLLENRSQEEIPNEVLEHLEQAQSAIRKAWGLSEFSRLANTCPADLDDRSRAGLERVLGQDKYHKYQNQPLQNLDREEIVQVIDELGRRSLTEVYRQLLLGVITELWVDYLTQMEALRVSIGLEAYAQRDPLVQYKSRASELFQELVGNMRLGVVSRMFIYQPRDLTSVQSSISSVRSTEEIPEEVTQSEPPREEIPETDHKEPSLAPSTSPASQPGVVTAETPRKQKKRRRRH